MAEKPARKTAAKKPAAKRTRKPAAPKEAPNDPTVEVVEPIDLNNPEVRAAIEKAVAEGVKDHEAKSPPKAESADPPQEYMRSLNGMCRIKLERHTPQQKGIVLQARGTRGDLAPIHPGDKNDPIFIDNEGLLFEVISAEEAREVVSKQTTNQQSVHPALAALRNERDEEYEQQEVKVEKSFEEQGVTVAQLDNGQVAFDRGGIKRKAGEAPGTPGYVQGAEPNHLPEGREAEFLSDLKAREKRNDDLGLKVTVNPVQKS